MQSSAVEVDFLKKVEQALREECGFYSASNSAIVVALSGGPDSVALIKALNRLIDRDKLYAVHINHMLRGEDSENDQLFCGNLCQNLKVPFYTFDIDVAKYAKNEKLSIELAARVLRHAKLSEIAEKIKREKEYAKVYIALGHNLNDKAETVLLNIGRGTALKGLCSMDFVNDSENLIRPLLAITRDEIEAYSKDLSPVIDRTNLETDYTRNKLRLKAIPLLSEIFDRDMTKMLSDMSNILKEDNDYLEKQSMKHFNEYFDYETISLNTDFIKENHIAISYRIIRHAISYVIGNLVNISSEHINDIFKLCVNNKSSKKINLPNGMYVEYKYNRLFFKIGNKEQDEHSLDTVDVENIKYEIFEADEAIKEKINIKAGAMSFDLDKLLEFAGGREILFRHRLPGDIVRTYCGNGSKKLKKYFIDSKIDSEIREHIPLLAVDNNIIWVVGYTVDDRFVVTAETKRILKIQFQE